MLEFAPITPVFCSLFCVSIFLKTILATLTHPQPNHGDEMVNLSGYTMGFKIVHSARNQYHCSYHYNTKFYGCTYKQIPFSLLVFIIDVYIAS